jgi:hypothetical protein
LKRFPVQYVKKGDEKFADQHFNLVYERLTAMKKKNLDGSTIKLYHESDYMCCYNSVSGKFRDDLDEHIARDHLKMNVSDFKEMNISQCNQCNQKLRITIIKPSKKGYYKFIKNCACKTSASSTLLVMKIPWTEVTLREIRDVFVSFTGEYVLKGSLTFVKSASAPISSMKRSNQSTVFSRRQKPLAGSLLYNNHITKEEKTDSFIKGCCLFLLRCFFIIILFWLIIIFCPKNDP